MKVMGTRSGDIPKSLQGPSVTDTGGGIYLYQSELSILSGLITISNNRANVCGGGIHAISTFLKLPCSRYNL